MSKIVGEPKHESNRPTKNSWSDRLVFAFEASKLNQTQFAKAVGVSSPTVHDWLHGNIKMIAGDHLVRVCQVLRINPLWLIAGQGEMMVEDRRQAARRAADRMN